MVMWGGMGTSLFIKRKNKKKRKGEGKEGKRKLFDTVNILRNQCLLFSLK